MFVGKTDIFSIVLDTLQDPYVDRHIINKETINLAELLEVRREQVRQLQQLVNKLVKENEELTQKISELEKQNKAYKSVIKIFAGNED